MGNFFISPTINKNIYLKNETLYKKILHLLLGTLFIFKYCPIKQRLLFTWFPAILVICACAAQLQITKHAEIKIAGNQVKMGVALMDN
jgi:hypothetical protein